MLKKFSKKIEDKKEKVNLEDFTTFMGIEEFNAEMDKIKSTIRLSSEGELIVQGKGLGVMGNIVTNKDKETVSILLNISIAVGAMSYTFLLTPQYYNTEDQCKKLTESIERIKCLDPWASANSGEELSIEGLYAQSELFHGLPDKSGTKDKLDGLLMQVAMACKKLDMDFMPAEMQVTINPEKEENSDGFFQFHFVEEATSLVLTFSTTEKTAEGTEKEQVEFKLPMLTRMDYLNQAEINELRLEHSLFVSTLVGNMEEKLEYIIDKAPDFIIMITS